MSKCSKCLRGARCGITGVNPHNTLKMDIGGAVLYVTPKPNGAIDVALNSESLLDGDYIYACWTSQEWIISKK